MAELLSVRGLRAGYGSALVIDDVSFDLGPGEALAVLGRNGVGKTTLINTLVGVTTHHGGEIHLEGYDLSGISPESRAAAGIAWTPQERNIFKSLTLEENLTAVARPGPWDVARVYKLFPRLAERKRNLGSQLSGGEQQMLAIGRALVLNGKVLLLDEPTEGLAPIIIQELLAALDQLFRGEGMAAIVVEQHAQKILRLTHRAIILDRGRIVHAARSAELAEDSMALERYLGVNQK